MMMMMTKKKIMMRTMVETMMMLMLPMRVGGDCDDDGGYGSSDDCVDGDDSGDEDDGHFQDVIDTLARSRGRRSRRFRWFQLPIAISYLLIRTLLEPALSLLPLQTFFLQFLLLALQHLLSCTSSTHYSTTLATMPTTTRFPSFLFRCLNPESNES